MRTFRLAALIVTTMVAPVAAGNTLPDPTQPMDFVARPANTIPGGPAVPTGPVLQSTLVSPNRKSAMISGKQVKVGDTYEGALITDITAYEVRMSRGGRETSLRLLPKLTKEKGSVE